MRSNSRLLRESAAFFIGRCAKFITLTFNWSESVSVISAKQRLRDFSRLCDLRYLGSRFYEGRADQRVLFRLTPEKFSDGYPHLHGVIAPPKIISHPLRNLNFEELVVESWKSVVPSGNVDMRPLYSSGAEAYASKETRYDSDSVIWSFDLWSARSLS